MIPVIRARFTNDVANPDLISHERPAGDGNATWVASALQRARSEEKAFDGALLLLLGGAQELPFRLRVAQSHVRTDMTPSAWSHVALVHRLHDRYPDRSTLVEIPLDPEPGFGWAPRTNAVRVDTPLARYGDADHYPNIAIVCIRGIDLQILQAGITQFQRERNQFDCCELILLWLAFCWGTGRSTNPLFDNAGIPSAVLIERLLGLAGREIGPGTSSTVSCPELIWQGIRFWHKHRPPGVKGGPWGYFHAKHWLLDPGREDPAGDDRMAAGAPPSTDGDGMKRMRAEPAKRVEPTDTRRSRPRVQAFSYGRK